MATFKCSKKTPKYPNVITWFPMTILWNSSRSCCSFSIWALNAAVALASWYRSPKKHFNKNPKPIYNYHLQNLKFLTVRVIVAISLSFACNCPSSLSTLASDLDMSDKSLQQWKITMFWSEYIIKFKHCIKQLTDITSSEFTQMHNRKEIKFQSNI